MKFFAKHIWKTLFLLTGGAAVWIGTGFTVKAMNYYRLANEALCECIHYGVISRSPEKNYLYADYQYSVGREMFSARYIYPKPVCQSKVAAESLLEDKKGEMVQVWYGKPQESVLERCFPMNDLIRLVVALGIMVYFALLRNYLITVSDSVV